MAGCPLYDRCSWRAPVPIIGLASSITVASYCHILSHDDQVGLKIVKKKNRPIERPTEREEQDNFVTVFKNIEAILVIAWHGG